MTISSLISQIGSWVSVYIFVNICKSFYCSKIKKIEYHIAIDELSDKKGLKLRFLDQMADTYVTVFHLLKFDKGLFLPYVGAVLSYTFLFIDKFKKN